MDTNTQKPPEKKWLLKRRNSARVTDHLANERTYLAWMRTAIALMGFGVVISRLRLVVESNIDNPISHWKLGFMFSGVGFITVLFSTKHYFSVRHDIDKDAYHPPAIGMIMFSLAILVLGSGVIYYLLVIKTNINPS